MSAVLTHEIEYVADVSKLTHAVNDARKQFSGAGTGLDKLAATSDRIANSLEHAAADASRVKRLGSLGGGYGNAGLGGGKRLGMLGGGYGHGPAAPSGAGVAAPAGGGGGAKGGGGGGPGMMSGIGAGFAAAATGALIGGAVKAGQAFAGAVGDVLETADAASNSRVFDPQAYQRLSAAAKKYDTDIHQVEAASLKLRTELGKAKMNPELSRGLKALGVTAKEIKRLAPEEQLALVSDRLRDFQDEGTRAIVAEKVFGTGEARALLPLLNEGGAAIKAAGDEAERLGLVMSDSAVEAAAQTKDALESLGARVDGLKTRLIGALMPTILDSADGLVETFDRMSGPIMTVASTVIDLLQPALESTIEVVSAVGEVAADAIGPLAEFWAPILTTVFEGLETIAFQLIDIFYDLAESMGLTGEDSSVLADAGDMAAEALGWLFEQASTVLDILGELAGIVIDVGALVWDLIAGIEEATGVFSGLASMVQDTVGGALDMVLGLLEDVSEMFDLFGSGEWIQGFKKLGEGILDFILEPLRMLVRDIIWVADAISDDLVPDSVRAFADNTREKSNAFGVEEQQGAKKSKRQERDDAKAQRALDKAAAKQAKLAEREETQRQRAAEKAAAGETKVSKSRMAALEGEGRKLSGPGLLSLGARDAKGREISVWLGKRLDTGRIAAAANRLGLPTPSAPAVARMAMHTPPRVPAPSMAATMPATTRSHDPVTLAAPGLALRPLSAMLPTPAAHAPTAPVTIEKIEVHTHGANAAENVRDFAIQMREVARDEISRQVRDVLPSINPGGLAG